MVENGKNEVGQRTADVEETQRNRRNFLKKAAKAATIAPAVTLLMSANTRPALASHVH